MDLAKGFLGGLLRGLGAFRAGSVEGGRGGIAAPFEASAPFIKHFGQICTIPPTWGHGWLMASAPDVWLPRLPAYR